MKSGPGSLVQFLLVFSALMGGLCTTANAGAAWRLVQSTGTVSAGGEGLVPVAVRPNDTLPDNGWVETGASGRAVLSHGQDTIIVGPMSRVQLPADPQDGNTQVLQSLGSALYQIGKEAAPHFRVDTPYLAAVVKGTTFVVSVQDGVARVDVTDGLVEVASPDGSSIDFVRPGHAGIVSPSGDKPGVVTVVDSRAGGAGVPPASLNLMKETAQHGGMVVAPAPGGSEGMITASIGDVDLNIRDVSAGLASGVVESAAPKGDGAAGGASSDAQDTSAKVALASDGVKPIGNPVAGGPVVPALPLPALEPGVPASGGSGGLPLPGGGSGGGVLPVVPVGVPNLVPDLGNTPLSGLPGVPAENETGNNGHGGGTGAPEGVGNGNGNGVGNGHSPVIPPKETGD